MAGLEQYFVQLQQGVLFGFVDGGEGRRLLGYTAPVEMPNKFGMAVRDPSGVVGLITPWNFPIAVPSWKIFPALVAGNTIIWKPSPETPAISAAFVKVFEEAGFQLRGPGCSACLGMNEDKIPAGKYCISTSNRNFEGRQGPGARTMLASPLVAAAAAVTGVVTDPRELITE